MKKLVAFLMLLFICGCAQKFSVVKLDTPSVVPGGGEKYISLLDRKIDGDLAAMAGEEMVRVYRYAVGVESAVNFDAPTTRRFPASAVWSGTYKYDDGKSGELMVYTTPAYCRGTVGVILDAQGDLATDKPVVQVAGRKAGRRWAIDGTGKFFAPSKKISKGNRELHDYWIVRYGGVRKGLYGFDICSSLPDGAVRIDQTLTFDEKEFMEGFAVKSILIRGVKKDDGGKIIYRVIDQSGEIVPEEFLNSASPSRSATVRTNTVNYGSQVPARITEPSPAQNDDPDVDVSDNAAPMG